MLNSIYSFKFTFSTITNNNEVHVKFALKGRVVAPWAWHQTCDQKVVGSTLSRLTILERLTILHDFPRLEKEEFKNPLLYTICTDIVHEKHCSL